MRKVAIVRNWFLPMSETFIYGELVNLKQFKPIVCTKKRLNKRDFPFKDIFKYKKFSDLKSIFRQEKVDLIHARFGTTGADLLQVKKSTGLPMVTSFHGFDLPSNKKSRKRYGKNLKRLFAEGEAFTVNSEDHKRILESYGCPEKKIHLQYSGINTDLFKYRQRKKPKNERIKILSVGRLVEKKGMKYLIEAFAEVVKTYPQAELRIVGDGPLKGELLQLIRRLKINHRVKLLGELGHKEVAKEMQKNHLFVLASLTDRKGNREGCPNVIKEAMASGLPVISTRHAGIPEIITHAKSGYLVPEKDSKALARRLKKVIKNDKEWKKIGKEGRKKIENSFDLQQRVRHLESIYEKVLAQK